jgi:predicted MFS family arabinose efflux permease
VRVLSVLRLPGVRWIVGLQAADLALEFASSVALMVLVYDATGAPLAAAGMLVAKQVLPGALLALAGARLDAFDPIRGLFGAYLVRAAAFGLLALAGTGAALYALAFFVGTAGTVSRVLIRSTVARVHSGREFREVAAAQNVVFGAMTLIGPALGAVGTAIVGAATALAVFVGVAAALALATLAAPARVRSVVRHGAPGAPSVEGEHADEGRSTAPVASTSSMLWLAAVLAVLFAMDEPALLAYVREALGADTGVYGAILVSWGIGVIAGGLLYSRYGLDAPRRAIVAGVAAAAVGYVALGVAPTVGLAYAAAVLGGIGNGVYWVALATAVLEQARPGEEAGASGRLEGIVTALPAAGFVLGGAVAQWIDARATLWAPGLAAVVVLVVWVVRTRSAPRRVTDVDDPRFARPADLPPVPAAEVLA